MIESALYYEAARAGLGVAFRDAVRMVLDRLLEHPEIGELRQGTRRLMVAGFPYDIVYRVTPLDVEVLAVAHHRRRPGVLAASGVSVVRQNEACCRRAAW